MRYVWAYRGPAMPEYYKVDQRLIIIDLLIVGLYNKQDI